jgi:predicted alpha/beta-hydrolase family hydrolase
VFSNHPPGRRERLSVAHIRSPADAIADRAGRADSPGSRDEASPYELSRCVRIVLIEDGHAARQCCDTRFQGTIEEP